MDHKIPRSQDLKYRLIVGSGKLGRDRNGPGGFNTHYKSITAKSLQLFIIYNVLSHIVPNI